MPPSMIISNNDFNTLTKTSKDYYALLISSAVQCPFLNNFLLIAKLYLWDCRRSQIRPTIAGFKTKIKLKFETEQYICTKNKTLTEFYQKWALLFTV